MKIKVNNGGNKRSNTMCNSHLIKFTDGKKPLLVRGVDSFKEAVVKAVLAGKDLSCADFSGKDLKGLHLYNVNLRGVNLTEADLSFSVFWRVDMAGVKLTGARYVGAVWESTNLHRFDKTEYVDEPFARIGKYNDSDVEHEIVPALDGDRIVFVRVEACIGPY